MLGEKIKQLRKNKGITQADLAQAMGLSQQAVARWEVNRSEPDNETMCRLASYFGVSSDYLLGIPIHLHADAVRNIVRNDTPPPSADAEKLRFVALLRGLQSNINALIESTIAEAMQSGETTAERNRRIKKDSTQSDAG